MRALVLTQERADALGYQGAGPFTFGGLFPGEYLIDRPVAVRYLGFADEDAAADAFDTAFADADVAPLEWADVDPGEGLPPRENHALSEGDPAVAAAEVAAAKSDAGVKTIRTHKDADAIGADLGITFPEGATVAEKTAAIDEFRDAGGDPDHLTAAPGAEDTVPQPAEEPA